MNNPMNKPMELNNPMNKPMEFDTIQTGDKLERCPFPIPCGWFCADYSDQLALSEVKKVKAFDKEWVMFRGEDGSVGFTDSYCPHLGANLAEGGTVVGNNIRCPFHHWEYDSNGWCKKIPYGKVMPGIAKKKPILQSLPIKERYGMIWVWYHPQGDDPFYDIPDVPELIDIEDHVDPRRGEWHMKTCLQEIGENSVDTPHLKFLHGAPIIPTVEANSDNHIFHFDIMNGYIVGDMHGPGIGIVRHSQDGLFMLMFSIPLPITTELTKTRMVFTFKNYEEGSKERKIVEKLYQHSIGEAEGMESAGFESVDMLIWNNKKYRPKPLLCDGDGPIMLWRDYYKQFYIESL